MSGGPSSLRGYTLSNPNDTRQYSDFVLYAPAPGTRDWRHHLLKLLPTAQSDQTDLAKLEKPVKLNRRDDRFIRALDAAESGQNEEVPAATAAEGKRAGRDESLVAPGAGGKKPEQLAAMRKRKPFEKKTSRVFQTEASLASRKIARQEQQPWLLEDGPGKQRWIGHLAGGSGGLGGVQDGATGGTSATKAGAQVLFVVDDKPKNGKTGMRVIPAERTYRFNPKHTSRNADVDDAELEFIKRSKSKVEDRWGYRQKRGDGEPGSLKADPDARPSFRAVHGAQRGGRGRVKREDGDEFDEVEFEEEMQDDEEGTGTYGDEAMEEEDAKLLEERIKRSQRGGHHLYGDIDTTQAEDAELARKKEALDQAGKKARKLLRKHKGSDQEDESGSEDESKARNPYASESEEESDENPTEDATKTLLAFQAGQPQSGKLKPKPLALSGSRAQSPASRSGSPAGSRAGSPAAATGSLKRKADDQQGTEKKAKTDNASSKELDALSQVLNEDVVLRFVKSVSTPSEATTRNLLRYVKNKLGVNPRSPGVSERLQLLIKNTCTLADGVLVAKPGL